MQSNHTRFFLARVTIDFVTPSTETWVQPSRSTPRPYRPGIVPGTIDADAFVNDLKQAYASSSPCTRLGSGRAVYLGLLVAAVAAASHVI